MTLSRRHLWLVLGIETVALAALVLWFLVGFDQIDKPSAILIGVCIVAAGDIATALILQRLAPTVIVLEPGERADKPAAALEDFDSAGRGFVLLRGERWKARAGDDRHIRKGMPVRILGRNGLTLIVEPDGMKPYRLD